MEKEDNNNDNLVDFYTVTLGFVPENINSGINIEIFLLFDYRLEVIKFFNMMEIKNFPRKL